MSNETFVCINACRVNGARLKVGDDITGSATVSAEKLRGLVDIGRIAPADSDEAKAAKASVKPKAPAAKKAPAAPKGDD